MKAAVLVRGKNGSLKAEVREMIIPGPGPGEAVVEMKACGLCGTDLEKMRGEYTASMATIGHEAVGVVRDVGEGVVGLKSGDRVFPHHHVPCGECHYCWSGNETMCERYRGSNLNPGGFSQFFVVPRWNIEEGGVLRIPDEMGFELASMIEPLGCCVRAMHRGGFSGGESVLIAGAGPVGMMNALLLAEPAVNVMISDINDNRLRFAERLGVGHVIDAKITDVAKEAKGKTKGMGVDLAVIASGSKDAIQQGLSAIRKGGRVVLFGIPLKGSVLDYDISNLYNSEQSVISSYGAVERDTREALEILTVRGDEFKPLITHRFPISEFSDAVAVATRGDSMKVVITP